jgi:hypothetical protein
VKHFVLDADLRVVEADLLAWGRWVQAVENREVAQTRIGHLLVVTSFAGIDLSFGDGPPAYFETRVVDGSDELECVESSSWEAALAEHAALTDRWSGWAETARSAAGLLLA